MYGRLFRAKTRRSGMLPQLSSFDCFIISHRVLEAEHSYGIFSICIVMFSVVIQLRRGLRILFRITHIAIPVARQSDSNSLKLYDIAFFQIACAF